MFLCLSLLFLLPTVGPEEKEAVWSGNIGFGLSLSRGNASASSVNLSMDAKRSFEKGYTWSNNFFYLYSNSDGEKTAESISGTTKLTVHHSPRTFSFYEIQAIRDPFKDYQYRLTPTFGLGYDALVKPEKKLSLQAGITHVYTRYYPTGHIQQFTGLRLSNAFLWKISTTGELTQKLEITYKTGKSEVFLMNFELGISAALSSQWALTFKLKDAYDSDPQEITTKKNDIIITMGLTKKFG